MKRLFGFILCLLCLGSSAQILPSHYGFQKVYAPPLSAPVVNTTEVYRDSLVVSWTAPAGATAYVVERDVNADFSTATQVYSGTGQILYEDGLSQNTRYYYRVKATAGAVASAWASKSVRTFWTPTAASQGGNRIAVQADVDNTTLNPDGFIEVGDYLVVGSNGGRYSTDPWGATIFNLTVPALAPGKKVCIIGGRGYDYIQLNMVNNPGTVGDSVLITSIGGQVRGRIFLSNCVYVKLTGVYDPVAKTGSPDYLGYASPDWNNLHQSFGFLATGRWDEETNNVVALAGATNHVAFEGIEVGMGGFAAILVKNDNTATPMEGVSIYNCYIHDSGGEGNYIGSTQSGTQMPVRNFRIYNNIFARNGGNAEQITNMTSGTEMYNNVYIACAMGWNSNFQKFQDQSVQFGARRNTFSFYNNLVLGGGENFMNYIMGPATGDTVLTSDASLINNNAFLNLRGYYGGFFSASANFRGTVNLTNNTFGRMGNGTYELLFKPTTSSPVATPKNYVILANAASTGTVTINASGNTYDASTLTGGSFVQKQGTAANITVNESANTRVASVDYPQFTNFMDLANNFDYAGMEKWCDTMVKDWNSTNKQGTYAETGVVLRSYRLGDIVRHAGKFYQSLHDDNTKNTPTGNTDSHWRLMVFSNGSTMPPDDVRLNPTDPYALRGIGLLQDDIITYKKQRSQ